LSPLSGIVVAIGSSGLEIAGTATAAWFHAHRIDSYSIEYATEGATPARCEACS
jgi:hypothetical protein